MKEELKEYIRGILNSCWDSTIGLPYNIISEKEMKEINCFIKNNRIEGYLYRVLQKEEKSNFIFYYCESLYKENLKTYNKIISSIKHVAECLKNLKDGYAFVNGSYFIPFVCKPGERIQKDIDIFVDKKEYEQIHKQLVNHGFVQSIIDGDIIREANRIERTVAFMNNKYVIPYYKKCQDENIGDIWIDIDLCDFSDIDFKIFLEKRSFSENLEIICLDLETNIVYACKTIYTKVKNYRYMRQKQDNALFYFCELNQMIQNNYDAVSWTKVEQRGKEMQLENAIYYTVSVLLELFGISYTDLQRNTLCDLKCNLKIRNLSFMNHIYDEKEHKVYRYDCSNIDYLFDMHREELLKENKTD